VPLRLGSRWGRGPPGPALLPQQGWFQRPVSAGIPGRPKWGRTPGPGWPTSRKNHRCDQERVPCPRSDWSVAGGTESAFVATLLNQLKFICPLRIRRRDSVAISRTPGQGGVSPNLRGGDRSPGESGARLGVSCARSITFALVASEQRKLSGCRSSLPPRESPRPPGLAAWAGSPR